VIVPLHTAFERWRAVSLLGESRWVREYDLSDDNEFFSILTNIADDQSRASGVGRLFALSKAITEDILDIQAALQVDCKPINLEFLQFWTSISPILMAVNNGEWHTVHDWILNGFSNEVTSAVERPFFTDRAAQFMKTKIAWIAGNRQPAFLDWYYGLYAYCRSRAALYEIAESLTVSAAWIISSAEPSAGTEACRFLLSWASTYDHPIAPFVADLLLRFFIARICLHDREPALR
jgi:hypothetical protein